MTQRAMQPPDGREGQELPSNLPVRFDVATCSLACAVAVLLLVVVSGADAARSNPSSAAGEPFSTRVLWQLSRAL